MSNKPRRLLQKYDLLLDHLDFDYIRQSTNGREVENIVKVLRSGEEGFFPQLTEFAEERLKSLKPNSKLLRKEQPLGTQHTVPQEQWNTLCAQLDQWQSDMKTLSSVIRRADRNHEDDATLPPVRKVLPESETTATACTPAVKTQRIASCDYEKWDKYDPDTVMLKMDLDDERHREMVRINNQKNSQQSKIIELPPEVKLTPEEKQVLAGKLREKGNDFFRAKEFKEAVEEYGKSLEMFATAACFNNRAMAYLKLQCYMEAISDCDDCLLREPSNVKALLRKAQALTALDSPREAYLVYCKVLQLEASNSVALSATTAFRGQLKDLPPPNAFRMAIEEVSNASDPEIDFSALVRPKKIIKNNLQESIRQMRTETETIIRQQKERANQPIDLLPEPPRPRRTPLIEEL